MEPATIGASVDASIAEPGVVGVSHLSPSSDSSQTGTAAFSAHGNPTTFNQALLAVTTAMAAARPFVSFVMRKLQQHVKKSLIVKKKEIDCSGCDVFDSGPMNPMRVTSLSVDGVFIVEKEAENPNPSRAHCFEQYQPYRAAHPTAISFIGCPELLNDLGVSEHEKL